MRTKLSLYNMIVSIFSQVIFLILSIIFPKWIISTYGIEINGLTASISQILNIINLLQAGIVGASIYDMYKPISMNDNEMIGEIYYSSKKYFNRLSLLFFTVGIILVPLFLMSSKSNLTFFENLFSAIILTLNGALIFKYFCSYDIIISAHQKKYVLYYSSLIEKLFYYFLLCIILFLDLHFVYMYLALLLGTIIRIVYLEYYFKKNYYKKIKGYSSKTSYKVRNQYYLLSNQVIQQIIESSPILIISSLYGLVIVGIFSLYNMIINAFKMLFSTIQNSIAASYGDLYTRDQNRSIVIFDVIQLLFINLGQVMSSCLMVLYIPFISIYTQGISNDNYINLKLSIFMSIFILLYCIFLPYNMVINSTGKYKLVVKQNIILGILIVILAIISSFFDYTYCIFVFGLFYLISSLDRIRVINSNIFQINIKIHIRRIAVAVLTPIIYYIIFCGIIPHSWGGFIVYGFLHFLVISIIVIFFDYILDKNVILFIFEHLKKYFKKRN